MVPWLGTEEGEMANPIPPLALKVICETQRLKRDYSATLEMNQGCFNLEEDHHQCSPNS